MIITKRTLSFNTKQHTFEKEEFWKLVKTFSMIDTKKISLSIQNTISLIEYCHVTFFVTKLNMNHSFFLFVIGQWKMFFHLLDVHRVYRTIHRPNPSIL